MTKLFTKIPDIAYFINGDIIDIEQSLDCGMTTVIKVHKIHLELMAQEMGIIQHDQTARMGEVLEEELKELFWEIEELWQSICAGRHMDLEYMTASKGVWRKMYSICRIAGLDPASLSAVVQRESEEGHLEVSSKDEDSNFPKFNQVTLI